MLEDNKEPREQAPLGPQISKSTLVMTIARTEHGIDTDVYINREAGTLSEDDVLESLGDIAFDIVQGEFAGVLTKGAS